MSSSLSFSTASVDLLNGDDLPAVLEIERRSNSHPWTELNFRDAMASGYLCLAARDDGRVCGFAIARLLPDEAELLLIAVLPECRRQGVAALLWQEMTSRLKASGAQLLHLEVRASNAGAQAFYASRGLQPSGRRPNYYPSGSHGNAREDAILMQVPL